MSTSFLSELRVWWQIGGHRRVMMLLLVISSSLLSFLFFFGVVHEQEARSQLLRLGEQVELIAEVDADLDPELRQQLESALSQLPGVQSVEYWPPERSARYIDQLLLGGYLEFLKKTQLEIPVAPLFRLRLFSLEQKASVEELLKERFPDQLLVSSPFTTSSAVSTSSFAQDFVGHVVGSERAWQVVILFSVLLLTLCSASGTFFLLAERAKGFHPGQWLHLAAPFALAPALVMGMTLALLTAFAGLLLIALFFQVFPLAAALLLWLFLVVVNGLVVTGKRFLTIR